MVRACAFVATVGRFSFLVRAFGLSFTFSFSECVGRLIVFLSRVVVIECATAVLDRVGFVPWPVSRFFPVSFVRCQNLVSVLGFGVHVFFFIDEDSIVP